MELYYRAPIAGISAVNHRRFLSDDRARGQRIIAAGAPLWLRQVAETLNTQLGARALKLPTREWPDWLIRAMGLFHADARFVAADLGKRRSYSSDRAETILDRPLRSLEEAVTVAGESLMEQGLA